jgi:serine/threonine protein kinase
MTRSRRNSGRTSNQISTAFSNNPMPSDADLEELVVVTELTTAGSMREYLRKIQHPRLKVIKEWLIKILEATAFLHENDIVHGKITCESIYYNSNQAEIKVGDIGIKQIFARSNVKEDDRSFHREQITKAYDVFCIGMVLLEIILTAVLPRNALDCLFKIINSQQTSNLLDHLTDHDLHDFAEKCINDNPNDRMACS